MMVRFDEEELQAIADAAEELGVAASTFVRAAALKTAAPNLDDQDQEEAA